MIRPLRIRHRRLILLVGILVAIVLVAGLRARREVPPMETLPVAPANATRGQSP